MVEENSTSEDHTTTNKGVNVRSESLPVRVHRYSDSEASGSTRPRGDLRDEIQNVLDLMGPGTPHLSNTCNTSSEADNEDSLSCLCVGNNSLSTSVSSKQKKSRESSNKSSVSTDVQTDSKQYTSSKASQTKKKDEKDSLMADFGTFPSMNIFEGFEQYERSCCEHAHTCAPPPECLCRQMCVHQSVIPVTPSKTCEGHHTVCKGSRATFDCKKPGLLDWLKTRSLNFSVKKANSNPCNLYKINVSGQEDECHPKRVVFDLVEGIPKPTCSSVATNTIRNAVEKTQSPKPGDTLENSPCNCKDMKNITNENITQCSNATQKIYYDSDGNKRVDFYYFDHGNAQYLNTTDTPPIMKCEVIAEKTERYTTKFWAEFFASIHIGVSFCVSFILQLFKFLLYSVLRPIVVGIMQMASDYFFKPCLTTSFNGLIQPFLIFLYNIATSIRDLCDPIAEACGYFCRELAVVFRAIRLCTYKRNTNDSEANCDCNRKYKCEC